MCQKIEKRHYILGFHCSIRPPSALCQLPAQNSHGPTHQLRPLVWIDSHSQQHNPAPASPLIQRPLASCNDDGHTSTASTPPTLAAGATPAVRRLAEIRRETCRPVPHLSGAGGGDGAAAGLQRRRQAEPRRGAPQRVSAQRRRRGARDQPQAASTTTSPPFSRLPFPFFLSSSSIGVSEKKVNTNYFRLQFRLAIAC
jgi:hypothetical protein